MLSLFVPTRRVHYVQGTHLMPLLFSLKMFLPYASYYPLGKYMYNQALQIHQKFLKPQFKIINKMRCAKSVNKFFTFYFVKPNYIASVTFLSFPLLLMCILMTPSGPLFLYFLAGVRCIISCAIPLQLCRNIFILPSISSAT